MRWFSPAVTVYSLWPSGGILPLMHLPFVRVFFVVAALVSVGGCATLTGEATQAINIQTVDASGKPVDGMACRIVNGSAEYMGDTPLFNLKVRKSPTPLVVECKRHGYAMARALIISRADLASGINRAAAAARRQLDVGHRSHFRLHVPVSALDTSASRRRHDLRPQRREGSRANTRHHYAPV